MTTKKDKRFEVVEIKHLPGRLFKVNELETVTAWIAGSKHPSETVFFTQIVYTLAHKQRLWDYWDERGMHFYFLEIELPFKLNHDVTPF